MKKNFYFYCKIIYTFSLYINIYAYVYIDICKKNVYDLFEI